MMLNGMFNSNSYSLKCQIVINLGKMSENSSYLELFSDYCVCD